MDVAMHLCWAGIQDVTAGGQKVRPVNTSGKLVGSLVPKVVLSPGAKVRMHFILSFQPYPVSCP